MQASSRDVAPYLSHEIGAMDAVTLWSDGSDIPVFALADYRRPHRGLEPAPPLRTPPHERLDGPGLTLPEGARQRIVVRNGFTRDLSASFLADLKKEVAYLDALAAPMPSQKQNEAIQHQPLRYVRTTSCWYGCLLASRSVRARRSFTTMFLPELHMVLLAVLASIS